MSNFDDALAFTPQCLHRKDKTPYSLCKVCEKNKQKILRKNNREKYNLRDRVKWLNRNYKVSIELYNNLFQSQDGKCAICFKEETNKNQFGLKKLSVDHCHITKKIRGLLCQKCNLGLGHFKDNLNIMEQACEYIRRSA